MVGGREGRTAKEKGEEEREEDVMSWRTGWWTIKQT